MRNEKRIKSRRVTDRWAACFFSALIIKFYRMIDKTIVETVISEMICCFKGSEEYFSKTRDVFSVRLQSYITETEKYLEAAIIGEIGNNTFDHNFGFITSYPKGAYCNLQYQQKYTVLADYGKGIKQSLLAVFPSIKSDREAVEIAFTKRVSGRSPEQRGNGLKFVSETIQQNKWALYFQSGSGACSIDGNSINFFVSFVIINGCLAFFDFNKDF
jgi:hypothetical protein